MISLEKRAEKVGIVLAKRQIRQAPLMRVGLALDISGSTRPLYTKGIVQDTVDRLLAVSCKFDDNGTLDMWVFDHRCQEIASATADDYGRYVKEAILENGEVSKWGATSYAPVMTSIVDRYFRGRVEKKGGFLGFGQKTVVVKPQDANTPALALFVTDGANDDRAQAAEVLRMAQDFPMYWQLVGIGDRSQFGFLEEQADLLPNVGFLNLESLDISDEALYEALISEELCQWLKRM